ncbi:MAG: hypothetical protein Q7T70_15135 [Polaromonas sp.]|nr:hypothetical protein [Polaromonas sp.]
MFSSHLPHINPIQREHILAGVGLAVVVSMLIAIAMVASGQVRKAEARESMLASQRTAIAYCLETLGGARLNSCLVQARGDSPDSLRTSTVADNTAAFSRSSSMGAASAQGFIPAVFTTHR